MPPSTQNSQYQEKTIMYFSLDVQILQVQDTFLSQKQNFLLTCNLVKDNLGNILLFNSVPALQLQA